MDVQTSPSLQEAAEFLERLDPEGEQVTFQTFGEGSQKGTTRLSRILHGSLDQHADTLCQLNRAGAGIFVTVNRTDGRGRKATNVLGVRAVCVDLDGAPLEPVLTGPLVPHIIVESSPRRWHAYWCIQDCPLKEFPNVQKLLAERFRGDPNVCDLPRVMRLPGFIHRKGEAYRTRIHCIDQRPAYTFEELKRAFTWGETESGGRSDMTSPSPASPLPDVIPEGQRNSTLFNLALGLVRRGYPLPGIHTRLRTINVERCRPPLLDEEVLGIAQRATERGSAGFTPLPDRLLDSPQWAALSPRAHDIIVLAVRRVRADSSGKGVALTHADFLGRPGFAKKDTFYRARAEAVGSGVLIQVSQGRNRQRGKTPDLFTVRPDLLLSRKSDLGPGPESGDLKEKTGGESSVVRGRR